MPAVQSVQRALLERRASPPERPQREPDEQQPVLPGLARPEPAPNAPQPARAQQALRVEAPHEPWGVGESGSKAPMALYAAIHWEMPKAGGSAVAGESEAHSEPQLADAPPLRGPPAPLRAWPQSAHFGAWAPQPLERPRCALPPLPWRDRRILLRRAVDARNARRLNRSAVSEAVPRHLRRLNWSGSSFRRHRVRVANPGLLLA